MSRIGFVILHYLSEKMTIECVDNIVNKFDMNLCHIVVVDNASPNGSGAKLREKYKNTGYCTVILNNENVGFSKGNNIGYRYIKDIFKPKFIVVLNNDVLIEDKAFIKKLELIYEETEYYVLGPDILACKTGVHQNPMRSVGYTKEEIAKIINVRKRWLTIYPLHFIFDYLNVRCRKIISKLIRKKRKSPKEINTLAIEKRIENPVLHGACYIFSEKYIENEENAFNPNTFLYFEEDILHYNCIKKNYLMLYDSNIKVKHMEDVSTDMAFKSQYQKRKMKYTNLINSASVLYNIMNDE